MGLWGRPRVCGRASAGHALWGFCGGSRAVAGRGRSWALAPSSGSLAHRLGGGSEALRGGRGLCHGSLSSRRLQRPSEPKPTS